MRYCLLTLSLLVLAGSASADTIIGLCGTGYSANCGALLNPNNSNDASGPYSDGNYIVYNAGTATWNGNGYTGTPVGGGVNGAPLVLSSTSQYGPTSAWADYKSGRWISPLDSTAPDPGCTQDQNNTACSFQALYVISFNIPIFADLSSVVISGMWTEDDQGHMVLNGTSLASNSTSQGGPPPENGCGSPPFCGVAGTLYSFTLTSSTPGVSFNYGTNYLGFQVDQADDYFDGVDVNSLSGSYNELSGTPEPASWTLLAAGALALGMLRRRRA